MMKGKKIGVALVGAGGIGTFWADALRRSGNARVVTVVDADKKRATSIAKDFPGSSVSMDIAAACALPSVDAVIIAVPHHLLAPFSLIALRARKHVLCEKPGAIRAKDITKNIKIAKRHGLIYMLGYNHRYHPAYLLAKETIKRGVIGRPLFLRAKYGFGGRPGYEKEWRFKKRISGGGEIIDQGMHMIDAARWFLGDITEVKGFAENLYWGGEVEDNGFLLLKSKKGQVASIHVSWTNWEWTHVVEVFGDKGYVSIEGLDQRYRGPERIVIGRHNPRTKGFPKEKTIRFTREGKSDSFKRELDAFTKTIRGERTGIPTGTDGYEALKIVEKVYIDSL